jgi:hypothetical protein
MHVGAVAPSSLRTGVPRALTLNTYKQRVDDIDTHCVIPAPLHLSRIKHPLYVIQVEAPLCVIQVVAPTPSIY